MNQRYWFILLTAIISSLLITSTLAANVPAVKPAEAQSLSRAERNWEYVYNDAHGTNFSPQTQISPENIKHIELKWMFPFPYLIQTGAGFILGPSGPQYQTGQGFGTAPLIIDGIVYSASQLWEVFALDGGSGEIIWRYTPDLQLPCIDKDMQVNEENAGCFLGPRHIHSISYNDGKIYLMTNLNGWGDIIVLDALSGEVVLHIEDYTKDLEGQRYPENGRYGMAHEWGPTIYEKGNLMIVQAATIDFNTRGFIRAYDVTTGELEWTWYAIPPAPDCKWEAKQANDAGKGNIDPALAVGDWGNQCNKNGAAGLWGHVSVDEETDRVYFGTSGPYPIWNATYRRGPNLYSNVIGALDARTGDLIWYYQTTTHDMHGEQDCKEGTMLLKDATVNGQKKDLVWNLCRSFNYILDADNGELVYSYYRWDQKPEGANPTKIPDNGHNMGNDADMDARWYQDPKTSDFEPFFGGNGGYAAWDPESNTIFFKSSRSATAPGTIINAEFDAGSYTKAWALPMFGWPCDPCGDPTLRDKYGDMYTNEIVAWDLETGEVKWKHDMGSSSTRGTLTVSNGMVCGGFGDAILRCWDTETGEQYWEKSFGTGAAIMWPPTFGANPDGDIWMYQIYGGSNFGGTVPGAMMAFGLPDELPEAADAEIRAEEAENRAEEAEARAAELESRIDQLNESPPINPISYVAIGIGVVLVVVAGILFSRKRAN